MHRLQDAQESLLAAVSDPVPAARESVFGIANRNVRLGRVAESMTPAMDTLIEAARAQGQQEERDRVAALMYGILREHSACEETATCGIVDEFEDLAAALREVKGDG